MKFPCLLILLFMTLSLQAQQRETAAVGMIYGVIADTTEQPIEGITVRLISLSDTTVQQIVVSTSTGNFLFPELSYGFYKLSVSGVGYLGFRMDSIPVRAERDELDLGNIYLQRFTGQMNEVVVYAEKPLFEDKEGVLTYNVSSSPAANSSSASELLKNMPMMSSDPDGKILLRGKAPRILIDDKPTDLNAQQLADLLESLPGSAIEKIELMMNPPPQYANEEGGVINIVTKKGKVGFTGRLNGYYGTRGEANLNTTVSYRDKKWAVSLMAGAIYTRSTGNSESWRENRYTDSVNHAETQSGNVNKQLRPQIRLNADYELTRNHLFNWVWQMQSNGFDNESENRYSNFNNLDDLYKLNSRMNTADGASANNSFNATYTFKGQNPRQQVRVIAGARFGKYEQDRNLLQSFLDPHNEAKLTNDSLELQLTDNNNRNYSLRVNYEQPLKWKPLLISSGFTWIGNWDDQLLDVARIRRSDQAVLPIPSLSSDFVYYERILGFRTGGVLRFDYKWSINAGVTAEETNTNFTFETGRPNSGNKYVSILPQATIRKEWESKVNASVVYRRTVRRPGMRELNPTVDESDLYSRRFGNPFLMPSIADNFDFTIGKYKGKSYVNASLGFNMVEDIFQQMRTRVNEKTEITYQNLSGRKEYEAGLWGGYTFTRQFRLNSSVHYLYSEYKNAPPGTTKLKNGGSLNLSANWTYTVNPFFQLEGSSRYSSFADAQGKSRANLSLQLGAQQKLLNKRMTVNILVIDPFRQQQYNSTTYGSNFTIINNRLNQTRNIRVGIAYNLTPPPKKPISKNELLKTLKKTDGTAAKAGGNTKPSVKPAQKQDTPPAGKASAKPVVKPDVKAPSKAPVVAIPIPVSY